MDGYQVVDHTADWALRVRGEDLPRLFRQAALGMSELMAPEPRHFESSATRLVEAAADDSEGLLVEWLGELAYWAEAARLIFPHIEWLRFSPTSLQARLTGGAVPALEKHIKAVTYHNLAIVESEGMLEATIVFDV